MKEKHNDIMKKEYDFSKGIKGKFYRPVEELEIPIYLDKSIQDYYSKIAVKKKKEIGFKFEVMMNLAQRLKTYQEDIDSGQCSRDPVKEIEDVREAISSLKLHKRISAYIGWYFAGGER